MTLCGSRLKKLIADDEMERLPNEDLGPSRSPPKAGGCVKAFPFIPQAVLLNARVKTGPLLLSGGSLSAPARVFGVRKGS